MRAAEQKGIMGSKDGTIFVTGGAGFIGLAVVRHLLRDTHARVVNIDKLTYAASLESLSGTDGNPHYTFEEQCICEGPALRKLFKKYQPDAVMNLAAESHVDRSIDGPGDFIQTDIVGTFTLLQEALRYWRAAAARTRGRRTDANSRSRARVAASSGRRLRYRIELRSAPSATPLADLIGDLKVSDGLKPGCGRHHFFDATSLSMALSSIASASNFFSFVFSSSSASVAWRRIPPARRTWPSICRRLRC
jgi:hypothetical protein